MTEKIINVLNDATTPVIVTGTNTNPTGTESALPEAKQLFGLPDWANYTFGAFFIAIGIACFFLYPRAKRKAEQYRKDQLVEYNKLHKLKTTDYSRTGMFLPAWEKAKMFAPVFFGMVFCMLGIAWIVGKTLFTM